MRRLATVLRTATLVVLLGISTAFAQSTTVDTQEWESVAQRAEQAVELGAASNEALDELRQEVSGFRDQWLQVQNAGDPRLQTLQSQLDALGPVPENGEEPQEISQRRDELSRQIAELRAPLLRAEEAFTRADGLVTEIDNIVRSRQTDALLERGPEPLDPRLWPAAIAQVVETAGKVPTEIVGNWRNDVQRTRFLDDLPAIAVMLIIAALLLFRAPNLTARVGVWLRDKTRRGTGVWTTALSLLRLGLPVAGLSLVAQAGKLSGLLGPLGTDLILLLPVLLFIILFTRWLAAQRFTSEQDRHAVALAPERRTEARFYTNALGWLLALETLVVSVAGYDDWTDVTIAVVSLPIHIFAGILLFRLGQILSKADALQPIEADLPDGSEPSNFPARLARLAGKGAMVVGVVGPILAAIGYLNVAQATIFPAVLSLGLFGIVLTLQNFVKDVYHLVTGHDLDQAESLVPVFSGILLTFASLPILALIWGARDTDLTELWARFQAGFSFGETRISPMDFLTFAIVFAIGYVATRLLQGGLRGSVLPKTGIDKGAQTAIVSGTGYIGIFLAVIIAVTSAGIDLSALAIVAGALSVGIGFGLQNIVQNFVSGIILLVERPISEGDWIEVGGHMGTVRDISVRSTRIETFDRTDVIIPNADFVSNSVTNYTRGNSIGRLIVDVGVAYGTDTRKVSDILYKIARDHEMVLMNPEPFVYFKGFGADSLDFDVRVILRDVTKMLVVRTELNHQITEAFAAEGIEIPFAQRDVWLRNPETLTAAASPKSETSSKTPDTPDTPDEPTTSDDPDEAAS